MKIKNSIQYFNHSALSLESKQSTSIDKPQNVFIASFPLVTASSLQTLKFVTKRHTPRKTISTVTEVDHKFCL